MELDNKNILSRINFILGKRKKHPWGRSIGLNSSRITDLFLGKIPGSDTLFRIANAEKISINWLLSGEGAPFYYKVGGYQTDELNAKVLKQLLTVDEWVPFVIYHQVEFGVALAITQPKTIDYGPEKADFIDVEIMQAGPAVLSALSSARATWLQCDSQTYTDLLLGEIGPEDIDGDRFTNRGMVDIDCLIDALKLPGNNTLVNLDESRMVSLYRTLSVEQRKAIQLLFSTMDNMSDVFKQSFNADSNKDDNQASDNVKSTTK